MEGYLIKHDDLYQCQICYCRLEDGYIRFYTSNEPNAKILSEFRLSGCKVDVKAYKRKDNIPFSFYIESQRVHVKDRTYALASKDILELSASTSQGRTEWGKSIFTWQRHYFQDQMNSNEEIHEEEKRQLSEILLRTKKQIPSIESPCNGFRIPSLRKSITTVLEVFTSRATSNKSNPVSIA